MIRPTLLEINRQIHVSTGRSVMVRHSVVLLPPLASEDAIHYNREELIIIIINFYGSYSIRNVTSEAQQSRIIKHNREQGRAKVIIRTRDYRRFMVEMQFGINVLSFLEDSCSFRCF